MYWPTYELGHSLEDRASQDRATISTEHFEVFPESSECAQQTAVFSHFVSNSQSSSPASQSFLSLKTPLRILITST